MIAYLDTSSIVKLYVDEDGTDEIRRVVSQSEAVAASWIAYAETRSAFARRYREGGIPITEYRQRVGAFEDDWAGYLAVDVSHDVIRRAGNLAEKHGLKALDAIHLASALNLKDDQASPSLSVIFSSADARLQRASEEEGLASPPIT